MIRKYNAAFEGVVYDMQSSWRLHSVIYNYNSHNIIFVYINVYNDPVQLS